MTERERVKSTYERLRQKHGDINETAIQQLAVKTERRRTLWVSIALLWGSILCVALYVLLPLNNYTDILIGCFFVFFIVCSFEYFKTILDSVKIKYHYLGVHPPMQSGILNYEQLAKNKKLRLGGGAFRLIKGILYDKDDADDSYVSWIYHKYNLYFKLDEKFSSGGFRTNRRFYLKAPLDAEYILILSDDGSVTAAYLSHGYQIAPELFDRCAFDGPQHNASLKTADLKDVVLKRHSILLEIILLALNAIACFVPMNLGLIWLPFTTFLATKFAIDHQNALSVINVIVGYSSIILAIFMAFSKVTIFDLI